jgi:hypothetical protein
MGLSVWFAAFLMFVFVESGIDLLAFLHDMAA